METSRVVETSRGRGGLNTSILFEWSVSLWSRLDVSRVEGLYGLVSPRESVGVLMLSSRTWD